jgi:hypothetical protein
MGKRPVWSLCAWVNTTAFKRLRLQLWGHDIVFIRAGESLEDTKIDEHTSLAGFDEIRRSCNAAGGSEER